MEILRVVSQSLIEVGVLKVYFEGTREQCYAFMRKYKNPAARFDLLYQSGRCSSWVL